MPTKPRRAKRRSRFIGATAALRRRRCSTEGTCFQFDQKVASHKRQIASGADKNATVVTAGMTGREEDGCFGHSAEGCPRRTHPPCSRRKRLGRRPPHLPGLGRPAPRPLASFRWELSLAQAASMNGRANLRQRTALRRKVACHDLPTALTKQECRDLAYRLNASFSACCWPFGSPPHLPSEFYCRAQFSSICTWIGLPETESRFASVRSPCRSKRSATCEWPMDIFEMVT